MAPRRLRHVIHVADAGGTRRSRLEGPLIDVAGVPPLELQAPLRGAGWLAANALSNEADHRRTIAVVDGQARLAQRFAIDFVQLDSAGRAFVGDPTSNEAWVGYGAPVLAAAAGEVEAVRDGLPDNRPLAPPLLPINLDSIGGNHVVVRLPQGQRVFYGHLKPGSIRVQPGQWVAVGAVLGEVGNSGQSDAPHLHIHVADGASALGAEGMPFVFARFRLEGHVPSLAVLEDPRGWQRSRDEVEQARQVNCRWPTR